MLVNRRRRLVCVSLVVLSACAAIILGGVIGVAVASTDNIPQTLSIGDTGVSLPTEILDRNGRLLSEFNGVEHHQPASIGQLPKYLIYALLTREDQNFFRQNAFSFRGTLRAALNDLTGSYFSGGSTITQQLAGTLFANRDHITIRRKLRELWYAFQIEKRLTKWQILQMYLNTAYFGRNNYGIEAASEFYFRRPAADLTLAESVALIIQLADPAGLDWISHPHTAKAIQRVVLDQMVRKGYVSQSEADQSYRQFWEDYPYNRAASLNPFAKTESKAPYFTSYVRQQLQQELYGNLSFLRDGLVVHTTLNLKFQRDAQSIMKKYIARYNAIHEKSTKSIFADVRTNITPALSLLGFAFNLPRVEASTGKRNEQSALSYYLGNLNPGVNALSMVFGLPHLAAFTSRAHALHRQRLKQTTVEGALITLDDHTGEILSMVGGYDWNQSQFNRAVDARLQEGSSIKPLYYSAAISSRKLTVASPLYDGPTVFWNPDGTPYRPRDFLGQWQGLV
ncbi:MAG TPA: transglycosylase domain-containing protein, partial [Spirochaetia bacterium]|nr:transglycosylase domain-containing protein [Spirochaetia bacterium]